VGSAQPVHGPVVPEYLIRRAICADQSLARTRLSRRGDESSQTATGSALAARRPNAATQRSNAKGHTLMSACLLCSASAPAATSRARRWTTSSVGLQATPMNGPKPVTWKLTVGIRSGLASTSLSCERVGQGGLLSRSSRSSCGPKTRIATEAARVGRLLLVSGWRLQVEPGGASAKGSTHRSGRLGSVRSGPRLDHGDCVPAGVAQAPLPRIPAPAAPQHAQARIPQDVHGRGGHGGSLAGDRRVGSASRRPRPSTAGCEPG
jgi:hypothetical protein